MRSVGKYLKFFYLGIIVVLLLMVALIKGSSSSQSGYYDDFQVTEVKTGWYSEESREEDLTIAD